MTAGITNSGAVCVATRHARPRHAPRITLRGNNRLRRAQLGCVNGVARDGSQCEVEPGWNWVPTRRGEIAMPSVQGARARDGRYGTYLVNALTNTALCGCRVRRRGRRVRRRRGPTTRGYHLLHLVATARGRHVRLRITSPPGPVSCSAPAHLLHRDSRLHGGKRRAGWKAPARGERSDHAERVRPRA